MEDRERRLAQPGTWLARKREAAAELYAVIIVAAYFRYPDSLGMIVARVLIPSTA